MLVGERIEAWSVRVVSMGGATGSLGSEVEVDVEAESVDADGDVDGDVSRATTLSAGMPSFRDLTKAVSSGPP